MAEEQKAMLSKEEIKNIKEIKDMLDYSSMCVHSNLQLDNKSSKLLYSFIEQLETNNQKLIEKLEERIQSVEKCYQDLIKPYYDEKINLINTSFMSKKEKEEFINKRNCLLVQKHCYEEILEFAKGEKE